MRHPNPRLPSAYRALLAEAVRRAAWHDLYCGQAARLGEHMVRFRDKEAARRSAFGAQVGRSWQGGRNACDQAPGQQESESQCLSYTLAVRLVAVASDTRTLPTPVTQGSQTW